MWIIKTKHGYNVGGAVLCDTAEKAVDMLEEPAQGVQTEPCPALPDKSWRGGGYGTKPQSEQKS